MLSRTASELAKRRRRRQGTSCLAAWLTWRHHKTNCLLRLRLKLRLRLRLRLKLQLQLQLATRMPRRRKWQQSWHNNKRRKVSTATTSGGSILRHICSRSQDNFNLPAPEHLHLLLLLLLQLHLHLGQRAALGAKRWHPNPTPRPVLQHEHGLYC